jgi:hypothetical protein
MLTGMAYAPDGFGSFAGQLFVAALRLGQEPTRQTHAAPANGLVFRHAAEGDLELVASGFRSPLAVHFVGDRLWVSDVSADFILAPYRELPDGFVGEIATERSS